MKDHKQKIVWFYIEGPEPLGDFINRLFEKTEGMVDVVVWSGDEYELELRGWFPMTEKEIEQAEARRKASAAANKAKKEKKEAEERALLEKLKAKYE
jgi:hypothetical protein